MIHPSRSYRCHYHPRDGGGYPMPAETGVLPFVQLKAANAEDAQRKAHHVTGCSVVSAERLEEAADADRAMLGILLGVAS